jgi:hypothetical protein
VAGGSAKRLSSRFARVRVRVGHSQLMPELLSQDGLLIEWPEGEGAPTKYWLSKLPSNVSFRRLVDFAKLRWRIERDDQELKQEVGLGHFRRARVAPASIITPRCASQPPKARQFPSRLVAPRGSRRVPYPTIIDPEDPPLGPERHIPNSIATMRMRLIKRARNLPRCLVAEQMLRDTADEQL